MLVPAVSPTRETSAPVGSTVAQPHLAGGETERALDCLMVMEALARCGLYAKEPGQHPEDGPPRGRVRLGALMVDTGLAADPIREILADLDQAGLVESGPHGRAFALTRRGLGALDELGLDVASIGELRRDLLDTVS